MATLAPLALASDGIDGQCGTAANRVSIVAPTEGLCESGVVGDGLHDGVHQFFGAQIGYDFPQVAQHTPSLALLFHMISVRCDHYGI